MVSMVTAKSKYHKNNEDSYFVGDDYLIIADGMGGESDGDIASKIAVDTISGILDQELAASSSLEEIKALSFNAIKTADINISEYINQNPSSDGMGTTILIAVMRDNEVLVSWCGDSHCFIFSNTQLESITKDHSYVQNLIDSGQISEEQSYTHPDNNLITRYVGGGEECCTPEFITHSMLESDILILCSDGLSGYCKKEEISESIIQNSDRNKLPNDLLNLAVKHGSDDDITIIVCSDKMKKSKHSFFEWVRGIIAK